MRASAPGRPCVYPTVNLSFIAESRERFFSGNSGMSTTTTAAALLGRKGGQAKSPAKAAAARANGKKGGWPKGRPRKAKA